MAVTSVDGKTTSLDVTVQRTGAGTVGAEHVVPSTLTGRTINTVITPFDPRVTYGGSWAISYGAFQGLPEDFLGQASNSQSVGGDNISCFFNGTSMAIIGSNVPGGGYGDVYIDGTLTQGRINSYTQLDSSYSIAGLNKTDTTITVLSTADFPSTGTIQVGGEIITYSGVTATTFTGCTRSGTASHATNTMVYGFSSRINFYAAYKQSRIPVWSTTTLTPGSHTIVVLGASAKDAASSGYALYISGFVVGGLIGAANISTNLDYLNAGSRTFDANGVCTTNYSPVPSTTERQILGVYGAAGYSGATFSPVLVSYNPVNSSFKFYAPAAASSTLNPVIVTVMVLGQTI